MADSEGENGPALLRVIGTVRLTGPDGGEIAITGRKTRGLLAYLALAPDRSATREKLCGLLWGDRGEAQARSSLRQSILELRSALAAAGVDALDAGRDRVSLRHGTIESDIANVESALAEGDAGAVMALLDRIGTAQLIDDLEIGGGFREWQEQTRGRVDRTLADGVADLLSRLEADGEWQNVRQIADAWLRRDPLEEAIVASAIRADIANGAAAQARRRFQAFEALLRTELGIEPGSAVKEALDHRPGETPGPRAPARPPRNAEPVLAVLAFDNLSSDPEMDYFSEGISEDILQNVARTAALKVIARASSFQFRGREKVTARISAELGASHLLDGSVRRAGNQVRISSALIECGTQTTLWSSQYDRDLSDIFAVQDEIADAVAGALDLIFAPGRGRARIDPRAYDFYLRARHMATTPTHIDQAVALLEEAVAIAPDFAAAWATLAMVRAINARWMVAAEAFDEAKGKALAAAETATALDPAAGLPYVARSLLEPEGRFAEREALFARAMALTPADPEILKQASDFAQSVGRMRESNALMARASSVDPLNPHLLGHVIFSRLGSGDRDTVYREMIELRRRFPDFDWASAMPLIVATSLGDWHIVDELIAMGGSSREWHMAVASANLLRQDPKIVAARGIEAAERQIASKGSVEIRTMMGLYNSGAHDAAFDAWARSDHDYRKDGRPDSVFLLGMIFDLVNAPMRKDVRFMDLCARLGLCAYWVETDRWPDCVEEVADHYDLKTEARRRVS